ncbi:hypothetical protein DOTSEDRAFT_69201 [Dothistroma septosporum NZE10]|uniref:Uncharacterized protein n=1 Tax=Dothistroma septosporum (strain NZE10 / CBS 128990) TaxID=675120 RepID=N1PW41_DOTSN|nr:hypothetical protein DOTSEDRAFT_69201 [Dothistroma septosporum NZE10]
MWLCARRQTTTAQEAERASVTSSDFMEDTNSHDCHGRALARFFGAQQDERLLRAVTLGRRSELRLESHTLGLTECHCSLVGIAITVSYILLVLLFCAVNEVTTSSRQLHNFARDGGLAFARSVSKLAPRDSIPMNEVSSTLILTIVLSQILVGSSLASDVIVSFGAASDIGATSSPLAASLTGKRQAISRLQRGSLLAASDY